jgi:nucleoside-diphosphate-sugar epimerase
VNPVLVTGATGLIGGNVCRVLAGQGRRVRALVRDPAQATELSALGAELVTGDITRPETLTAAVSGCAAVVHAAAVLGGASQVAAALGRPRPVPAFDNTRTRSQLEYRPHALTEALAETVGWLRTTGQIA